MITVKPIEYLAAYEYAKQSFHKKCVNEILLRANKALEETIKINTTNVNHAQIYTYVYLDYLHNENLSMLEEAAQEITKHGFCVNIDDSDSENIRLEIFVKT